MDIETTIKQFLFQLLDEGYAPKQACAQTRKAVRLLCEKVIADSNGALQEAREAHNEAARLELKAEWLRRYGVPYYSAEAKEIRRRYTNGKPGTRKHTGNSEHTTEN